ncbi:hypothetical protein ACFXAZ_07920 [Streptomyces sp. NPDC059477]|uniref:hypothetical protein n=1 Tax=Streptomyces sp. NPDC059477 TaxID=3346847 RepID=UPI0036BD1914
MQGPLPQPTALPASPGREVAGTVVESLGEGVAGPGCAGGEAEVHHDPLAEPPVGPGPGPGPGAPDPGAGSR